MTLSPLVVLLALTTIPSFAAAQDDGAALYLANCARCHGETGAGDGPESAAQERPPRSFAAGAFSFGDTPTALERTIANGIPGSPMAAFGEALSEAEIAAIAEHLITLMPARRVVGAGEAEIVIGERPVMARGHLGALVSGARAWPRALVLGTPNHPLIGGGHLTLPDGQGMTAVYGAEDLRLLQVRQGPFVRRTDWTGRGGTPIELLGEPVWTAPGGDPPPEWFLETDHGTQPLRAVLRETRLAPWSGSPAVELLAELVDDEGSIHAEFTERAYITALDGGLSLMRRFAVTRRSNSTFVRRLVLPPRQRLAYVDVLREGLAGGPCHPQRPQRLMLVTRDESMQGENLYAHAEGNVGLRPEHLDTESEGPIEAVFAPSDPSCDQDEPTVFTLFLWVGSQDDSEIQRLRDHGIPHAKAFDVRRNR